MVSRLDRASIGVTTAISLAVALASAYYVPQISTNGRISNVETAYARIDEKQSAQEKKDIEDAKRLDKFEEKIDKLNDNLTSLLIVNGIQPKK